MAILPDEDFSNAMTSVDSGTGQGLVIMLQKVVDELAGIRGELGKLNAEANKAVSVRLPDWNPEDDDRVLTDSQWCDNTLPIWRGVHSTSTKIRYILAIR